MRKSVFLLCLVCALLSVAGAAVAAPVTAPSPPAIAVPDTGWRLWLDRNARWRDEPAYLPGDASLDQIATRPPTGGWSSLSDAAAKVVTLPTTVEQHFWGATGLRPYHNEAFYEKDDPDPKNGNYIGVSWWWRRIVVPKSFAGRIAILHIRAAKQRAEVYVNRQLVGYSLIGETAFDCDVTRAVRPGAENTIAIRITNPGGRLDWGDWGTATLGKLAFYAGHAFGGLDRGITLTAHGPVRFTDSWVLNTPDPRTIEVHARVWSALPHPLTTPVITTVIDPATGKTIVVARRTVALRPNTEQEVSLRMRAPSAGLWDLQHPKLYRLRFEIGAPSPDRRETTFAFRWFGPSGIGKNAVLRLNGRRIRVYSAISWGFWGLNGLWPTPYLAEKEVRTARSLGLNALNFHRNIARAEALDAADRIGLLRYTEPGGAMSMFWGKPDPKSTLQRYMVEKIVRMVRDHRSHPSLIVYVVQNEMNDGDYKNPLSAMILRRIHQEDPSRCAILKSGLSGRGEMWMMPYDNTLYVDRGDGYSGWWDEHSVGTPDSWTDADYRDPSSYVYRNTDAREIVDYGEMGGSGAADNHTQMLRQIRQLGGGQSYDRLDHEQIAAAYDAFLDRFGFRSAFPTAGALFAQIGAKQYDYWNHVLSCARLSDSTDYLTVSGWETTAIEDHGGIVDNLRNPHGNPAVIAAALRPVLPDLQLRRSAIVRGQSVTYDLFFVNETNRPERGSLLVTLTGPTGAVRTLGRYPVPPFRPNVFSYPVAAGLTSPALDRAGDYRLSFSLGPIVQTRTIHVVDIPRPAITSVGLVGGDSGLSGDLAAIGVTGRSLDAGGSAPAVAIAGGEPQGTLSRTDTAPSGTADPDLYRVQRFGQPGNMAFRLTGLPDGPAKVTLGFSEIYYSAPGSRVFDVNINGRTVLTDLDVLARAGGKDRVWTTTVDADVVNGQVIVEPGRVRTDNAMFSTIRIDAGGKTVAIYFGGKPYRAPDGTVWQPYVPTADIPEGLLDQVRAGMGLIVLPADDVTASQWAERLAGAGAFRFDGLVGRSRAPWMGSWYFVRAYPLYAGLPVNTVMKGDYQVGVGESNGLLVRGPGIEIVTGYSRDHSRQIGAGDVVARLGKGRIVFHVVPRMTEAFQRRWLANALTYAAAAAAAP